MRALRGSPLLLVAVPLVAMGAALRGRLGSHPVGGVQLPTAPASAALAVVWALGAIRLITLLARAPRRRHKDDPPRVIERWQPSKRAQLAAAVFALAAIAIPVGLIIAGAHISSSSAPPPASVIPHSSAPKSHVPSAPHHTTGSSGPATTTILVIVIVLAIAGTLALVAYHHGRPAPAPAPAATPTPTLSEALHAGLRQGAVALDSTDDVRLAIVRCYAAMQRSLDRAGLPRSPVRTPTELLAAATEQRLLPAQPATVLTRLFERARFSSDPMTPSDRDAARDALHATGATR